MVFTLQAFLYLGKKTGWPAWTQSGSSSGPSFPSITSRDYYSVLNSPISHVPLPPPHFNFGMTWLELDDKALLESYAVLQEGILYDVFSQKCSAAWQRAPAQRLTVAIFLAVRWQMTGLTSCCHKGTYGPPLLPRGLRLQAKHLWVEVKLSWNVLSDRMYTIPTGKWREQLYEVLFNKAARGKPQSLWRESIPWTCPQRSPGMVGAQCQAWMLYYKCQCAPLAPDIKSLLHAFRQGRGYSCGVDAYFDHCGKRWQTREGTYELKRRRLLPDVRDPPEQEDAAVDMNGHLTLYMDGMEDYFMVEEMIWGDERGASCFTLFCESSLAVFCLLVFFGVCFVCFLSVLLVKTLAFNSRFTFLCEFLVVDRPCLVLARQCRKMGNCIVFAFPTLHGGLICPKTFQLGKQAILNQNDTTDCLNPTGLGDKADFLCEFADSPKIYLISETQWLNKVFVKKPEHKTSKSKLSFWCSSKTKNQKITQAEHHLPLSGGVAIVTSHPIRCMNHW